MNSSGTDSEESVIETTPVKKKPCILKKIRTKQPAISKVEVPANQQAANAGNLSQNKQSPDLLDDLIQEGNRLLVEEGTEGSSTAPNNLESNGKKSKPEDLPLAEPIYSTHSKNPHKTHVFYLIQEILEFRPESSPKNCNIQLAGTVRHNNSFNIHFLNSLQDDTNQVKIKIILKDCPVKPQEGSSIIAFGMLAFEEQIPFIVVRFFQLLEVQYHTFISIMSMLRSALPLENMEKTSEAECFLDSTLEGEEMDNLVKSFFTLDSHLEKSSKEGDSCISDKSQFSDTYWNQVLDDLSFEKVCSEASGGTAASGNVKK